MSDTAEQLLRRLLATLQSLQAEHSAIQPVLRSIAETHPNRPALLARLVHHQQYVRDVAEGQPLTDAQIAARHAAIEHWRRWIEQAPLYADLLHPGPTDAG